MPSSQDLLTRQPLMGAPAKAGVHDNAQPAGDIETTRWAQIAQALREEIVSGQLAPGARLPNENLLAQRFGVHRHTLRQAVQQLVREGHVQVRHGAGSFVRALVLDYALQRRTRLSENLADNGERGQRRLLRHSETSAGAWAAPLGLSPRARVLCLLTLSSVRGRPLSLSEAAFPLPRLAGMAEAFEQTGSITAALHRLGVADYTRLRSSISARLPTAAEADALARPAAEPVLVVQYLNVDRQGQAVEAGRSLFAADAVQLTVEHGP